MFRVLKFLTGFVSLLHRFLNSKAGCENGTSYYGAIFSCNSTLMYWICLLKIVCHILQFEGFSEVFLLETPGICCPYIFIGPANNAEIKRHITLHVLYKFIGIKTKVITLWVFYLLVNYPLGMQFPFTDYLFCQSHYPQSYYIVANFLYQMLLLCSLTVEFEARIMILAANA